MKTRRSDSPSMRHRSATASAPAPAPASRTQSFTCSTELLRAFERRTFELGCTFDWLLEEAMQRLLAEANEERKSGPPESAHQPVKPPAAPMARATVTTPLPLPPDAMPSTLPPPPSRAQLQAAVALPAPPPPSQRSRTAVPADEPLHLACDGGDSLVIDYYPYVIGRSRTLADLVIESGAVSRRHAVIEHTSSGWMIRDLGSTNGIIVNGLLARQALLGEGVMLSIGPMTFVVTAR